MTFAAAGHPPAMLVSRGRLRLLDSQSGILGCLPETAPSESTDEIDLTSGDRLVLYTDGLVEVFNQNGFLFPLHRFLPSHAVGILSLIVLPTAIYALYMQRLAGAWNLTYSMAAVLALYLNVFVLTAQFFAKLPLLKAMAPTQSEAPFNVAQLGGLMLFITLGILVAKSSRSRQLSIT